MPAKFKEKKSNRLLQRAIKDKGEIFLLEEQRENFVTVVEKIRDTCGHQGENERQSKNEQEHVRSFPP